MPENTLSADPHRATVYAWEDEWNWNYNTQGIKALRSLIRRACKRWKVKYPTVVHHHVRAISFSMPAVNYISLQGGDHEARGGRNPPTALHEAAHHITYVLYGEKVQDHGRTFLGIYLDLLVWAKIAPPLALYATARAHGLKWASLSPP